MAPLPIGFAVFMVHLATIPVTGTGINPARSLGSAVILNQDKPWDDHVSLLFHIYRFLIKFDIGFKLRCYFYKLFVSFNFFNVGVVFISMQVVN